MLIYPALAHGMRLSPYALQLLLVEMAFWVAKCSIINCWVAIFGPLLIVQLSHVLIKMGQPRPLFNLFSVFSIKYYNSATNQCEKCPSCSLHLDLNSRPSDYESPHLTTRP